MGKEIDLLNKYPKTKRNLSERAEAKTEEDRAIARKFEKDFFDGDRKHGYGGFYYNPRFWKDVVEDFRDYWNLNSDSSVLDVGCGKGFMLYDLVKLLPGINVAGVDISNYAIENSVESIKPFLKVANATSLPYEDKSFDVVISINTIHNLEEEELIARCTDAGSSSPCTFSYCREKRCENTTSMSKGHTVRHTWAVEAPARPIAPQPAGGEVHNIGAPRARLRARAQAT